MSSKIKKIGQLAEPNSKMVEWTIHNFVSYREAGCTFRSPYFYLTKYLFYIRICPNGVSEDTRDIISLFLFIDSDKVPKVVKCTFGIKSTQNEYTKERKFLWRPIKRKEGMGYKYFISRSKLLKKSDLLVPANSLTITCLVQVKDCAPDYHARISKLATNLKDMYISKRNADVFIKVQDETFSAHRFILSARSPVLAAMFDNDMIEKRTGFVDIPDCDSKAFNHFLFFLYSGELHSEECDFIHLYKIADKYDVQELKLLCIDSITEKICVENFCESYLFAYDVDEAELLTTLRIYFKENYDKIVSADSMLALMKENCDLANRLLKSVTQVKKKE